MTRWSLIVSDDTDQRLRTLLGSQGAKKGSLSRYVEQAVAQRLRFEETVNAVQERNLAYAETDIETAIADAVTHSRETNHNV